jgi:Matrixin
MWRLPRAAAKVCAMTVALCAYSHGSDAFEVKHTSTGQPLRWNEPSVSYVVDPSVEQNVPGGAQAVSNAVAGWSASVGGPIMSTSIGPGGAKAGLDGQNSVLFAPNGFAPAGSALAITVVSYDDASGAIVDADVVVNGKYPFAVLAADAEPAHNASPVSTDGTPTDAMGSGRGHQTPFDIVHVVAHEAGHSLGLADDPYDHADLMFAYTTPGDATVRLPSSDDVDGVEAIYGATPAAPEAAASSGCGQSSVAGSRARPADALAALALVAGVGMWLASRRLAKTSRVVISLGAAFVALAATGAPARSAQAVSAAVADASARVLAVSTTSVDGLFETTLELAPTACRIAAPCPSRATAHAWGGHLGGITQRIGGDDPLPAVGDVVGVTFPAVDVEAASAPVAPGGSSGSVERVAALMAPPLMGHLDGP